MKRPHKTLGDHVAEAHEYVNRLRRSRGLREVLFEAASASPAGELRIRDFQHRREMFRELCPGLREKLRHLAGEIGWDGLGQRIGLRPWRVKAIAAHSQVPNVGEVRKFYELLGDPLPEILTHDFRKLRMIRKSSRIRGEDLARIMGVTPPYISFLETGKAAKVDVVTAAEVARWEREQCQKPQQ